MEEQAKIPAVRAVEDASPMSSAGRALPRGVVNVFIPRTAPGPILLAVFVGSSEVKEFCPPNSLSSLGHAEDLRQGLHEGERAGHVHVGVAHDTEH